MPSKNFILVYTNDKQWKVVDIANKVVDYETLSREVGGCIEHLTLEELKGIDVWVDDEGKLKELNPNIIVFNHGFPVDTLNGNVVFTRSRGADTISLRDDDIEVIENMVCLI